MARRTMRVTAAIVVTLVISSGCGSDDETDGTAPADEGSERSGDDGGSDGAADAEEPSDAGVDAMPVGEAPELDPSTMPPPGEARVEVDGQTFVFLESEMIDGVFACEVRDDGITINFQSDRHDMLLQGAAQADGTILASTTVVPEESDFRYASTNGGGNGGGVAVQGQQVLYAGRFDATPKDDLASFADVGQGTVAVTCPTAITSAVRTRLSMGPKSRPPHRPRPSAPAPARARRR